MSRFHASLRGDERAQLEACLDDYRDEIARLLDVPVSAFFEEKDEGAAPKEDVFGFLSAHGAIELLRAYALIENDQMRRDVLAIVRTVAKLGQPQADVAEAEAAE